jgi:hypothetical protein
LYLAFPFSKCPLDQSIKLSYCCIVGQQRSRMLATLYKDERCQQLPAYNILEKMYLDRLIKHSELVSVLYNSFSSFRDGGEK